MTLADKATGKDNNLNLIRFLAAMAGIWAAAAHHGRRSDAG